jgi:hypothetical protein
MNDVKRNQLAPIVLFVYNRPEHTRQTLEALSANHLAKESKLYVFCDAPRDLSAAESAAVQQTRKVVESKAWCGDVSIRYRTENVGLAENIVSGLNEVLELHDRVIVLEDDIVTSKGFLKYMNESLVLYEKSKEVMHISAYMYPVSNRILNGTIFLKILSCWGWGTWKRAWCNYSNDLNYFLGQLQDKSTIQRFNIKGHATFYDQLLLNYNGKIRTWAVRWYASWYFQGGYSLFPKTTLVVNIGHDGSGQNSATSNAYCPNYVAEFIEVEPVKLKENKYYLKKIDSFYARVYHRKKSMIKRVYARLKKIFNI